MKDILIISPDPEAARMIALALEVEGFGVDTASSISGSKGLGSAPLLLLDAADGIEDLQKSAGRVAMGKSIVILPRGMGVGAGRKALGSSALFVKRPFYLTALVKLIKEKSQNLKPQQN